jgi:hypothetical protein
MKSRSRIETHAPHAQAISFAKVPDGQRLTILAVDSDLGFLCWLGCALSHAGHVTLPAVNCRDAFDLLSRVRSGIDLLVVNYSIQGASALAMALSRSQRHLKVIALVGYGDEPCLAPGRVDAFYCRCSHVDEASETEWLETIEGVLACGS